MKRWRGFTLIELMVTLTILAVLASVALPLSQVAATRTREDELRRALWQIRSAIDAYKQAADEGRIQKSLDETGFPPTLASLTEGVKDIKDPTGRNIYFLRRMPRDPFCDCPSKNNEQTWGLRSYASPPDSPAEGRDVYDVYTLSNGVGLNGVPYRDW
ncbi:type II secretion system pseudopilin PulG [Chitiniphilus shinanonensis]|uniref:Type II secretion system pseudopilin PulG n=1 Tax=Chitiniphilus shinanonensis TaxID=553088 RepID=A0ABQ6BP88_9NEIS|nr:type II secretion system protein [Chitiniphilus shinanonensis]GLS03758.1 type II secretion system pseudopilin PulG [Chitiniphilus shinanonensis]